MPPVKPDQAKSNPPPAARPPGQDDIARRAYAIWQDAGSPDGSHDDHWRQAEQDLSAPAAAGASTTPYSASGSSSVSGQGATSSGSGLGGGSR
jgi:hypothetical protein